MGKFKLQISVLVSTLIYFSAIAQPRYSLRLKGIDKDSASIVSQTGIQTSFTSRTDFNTYFEKLPALLQSKGFITASIDSLKYDSSSAYMALYLGNAYRWAQLNAKGIEPGILDAIGWREKIFSNKPIDFNEVGLWEERMLNHMENTGYPFAKVYLDSISIERSADPANQGNEVVAAILKLNKGPLYKIDSIRVYGNAKIDNQYLQRYLEIPNGSLYNKDKLFAINKKIRELSYVEEEKQANLDMLGTGAVLNMYLRHKKSSQVNILVGFLPNNDQLASKKLLITGEGNLLLRNALSKGETIGLNFQALQVESQRLNFIYQHPYVFRSPLGFDFYFDFLRKDSSFITVNIQVGAQYNLNTNQSGKLFIQKLQTIMNEGGVNPARVIQTRKLPEIADVSSYNIGLDYTFNNTDYRLNPKKGFDVQVITTIGTKNIKKSNAVLSLKDPSDPAFNFASLYEHDSIKLKSYQLRVKLGAARFFPLGNQRSTIKMAINAGILQSGNIFRNELFQIGGYKLLRGFDEESQYLSQYSIATLEYRYLVDQNSYFYVLADGGWGRDNGQSKDINYSYFGTGLGLAFETKAGIFNLAWAVGKRNDGPLNLRQSKIHFGFVNYF